MKHVVWMLAVPAVALGAWFVVPTATSTVHAGDGTAAAGAADDGEVDVALESVPESVLSAATARLPGITFTSAEREIERGVILYCLVGTLKGKAYEVEVTADGKVVEVEDGDDDDDGEDDDDRDGDDHDH